AHAHHGGGLGDQFGDVRGAAHHGGGRARGGGQVADLGDVLLRHLRAGDQQVPVPLGHAGGRGGAGQLRPVRAASEDGQHVGRGWFRGGALGARGAAGGTAAGEVAGGGRLLREGGRQLPGQARIVDVLVAVDPDRVEERGHELGSAEGLPFGGGHARGIEHLPQAQHGGGAAGAEVREHRPQLAVDAEGVPVGDEQVRLQGGEGRADGGAAQVPHRIRCHAEAAGAVP